MLKSPKSVIIRKTSSCDCLQGMVFPLIRDEPLFDCGKIHSVNRDLLKEKVVKGRLRLLIFTIKNLTASPFGEAIYPAPSPTPGAIPAW